MKARSFSLSLALIVITIGAGAAIRFAHLGLPPFVVKYGGSTLWAVMLYWMVSTVLPRRGLSTIAMTTALLATVVELVKLYHSPGLDAFRHTLPGVLLLGRIFSVWDIVAYWLAIVAAAVADKGIRKCLHP